MLVGEHKATPCGWANRLGSWRDMAIPDERIDDLIERWAQAFGERISRDEARAVVDRVLHLYWRLVRLDRMRARRVPIDSSSDLELSPAI
jgi:hypothetical protein